MNVREAVAILHAAQQIDPRNIYDAEYIVAHPSEYSAAQLRVANETLDHAQEDEDA